MDAIFARGGLGHLNDLELETFLQSLKTYFHNKDVDLFFIEAVHDK